jgi:signal transduction histidine kinase
MEPSPAAAAVDRSIRVLCVGAEAASLNRMRLQLEDGTEEMTVLTETSAAEAVERLKTTVVDCVVSECDAEGTAGPGFLRAVTASRPDLPVVLFVEKGSASRALRLGASEIVRSDEADDRYEVLSHRVRESVRLRRLEGEPSGEALPVEGLLETRPAAALLQDESGTVVAANERAEALTGATVGDGRAPGERLWGLLDEQERPLAADEIPFERVRSNGTAVRDFGCRLRGPDGRMLGVAVSAVPLWTDRTRPRRVLTAVSEHPPDPAEQAQADRLQQLEAIGDVLSHDLGNMLYVASGRLELGQETGETEHLEATETALERASEMLENLTMAIRAGTLIDDVAPVEVGTAFRKAWNTQPTEPDSSVVVDEFRVCADETALQRLFENLVRNALEHGNEPSEVRVGQLPDGFYSRTTATGSHPKSASGSSSPGTRPKTMAPVSVW